MRGCRGADVESSVHAYQNSQRRTNSGEYASDWRRRGEEAGRVIQILLKIGECKYCPKFTKKYLSVEAEQELKRCWGESSIENRKDQCVADVDNFIKDCPKAKEFYEIEKQEKLQKTIVESERKEIEIDC